MFPHHTRQLLFGSVLCGSGSAHLGEVDVGAEALVQVALLLRDLGLAGRRAPLLQDLGVLRPTRARDRFLSRALLDLTPLILDLGLGLFAPLYLGLGLFAPTARGLVPTITVLDRSGRRGFDEDEEDLPPPEEDLPPMEEDLQPSFLFSGLW